MKSKIMRLTRPGVVIPMHGFHPYQPLMLAAGSLVQPTGPGSVINKEMFSPFGPAEIDVLFFDTRRGGWSRGHLAKATPLMYEPAAENVATLAPDKGEIRSINAWDAVRFEAGHVRAAWLTRNKKVPTISRWRFVDWCSKLKTANDRTKLANALRELGGRVEESNTLKAIITRILRVTTEAPPVVQPTLEVKMSSTTKAAPKKAAAPKSEKPARSAARTAGAALAAAGFSHPVAKKLANDEKVTKKEVETLRDAINEKGAKLREENKGSAASKLSAANKLVRRVARGL